MLRGRYFTHGAAELTLALILAASRHLDEEEVRNFRSGRWMTTVGRDLRGSRLASSGSASKVARWPESASPSGWTWSRGASTSPRSAAQRSVRSWSLGTSD